MTKETARRFGPFRALLDPALELPGVVAVEDTAARMVVEGEAALFEDGGEQLRGSGPSRSAARTSVPEPVLGLTTVADRVTLRP